MLSHQLESFQHTHRHGLPCFATGMAMALGRKAVQLEEEHLWCVFNHCFAQEMLLEGAGEQAVLKASLADHLLAGQGINNSIQLSGH